MKKPKDDSNLISEQISKKLRKNLEKNKAINRFYISFVKNEEYCRRDIIGYIDVLSQSIVKNSLIKYEDVVTYDLDFLIKSNYHNTKTIMENVFAVGVMYGRGIYEGRFTDIIKDYELSDNLFKDINTVVKGQKPSSLSGLFESDLRTKPDNDFFI